MCIPFESGQNSAWSRRGYLTCTSTGTRFSYRVCIYTHIERGERGGYLAGSSSCAYELDNDISLSFQLLSSRAGSAVTFLFFFFSCSLLFQSKCPAAGTQQRRKIKLLLYYIAWAAYIISNTHLSPISRPVLFLPLFFIFIFLFLFLRRIFSRRPLREEGKFIFIPISVFIFLVERKKILRSCSFSPDETRQQLGSTLCLTVPRAFTASFPHTKNSIFHF